MIVHYEIEQGSEAWHSIRYGKIGGTSSKGLFVDSDALLYDLIACRLEAFKLEPPSYQNEAMLRGNELEPFARMEMSRKVGIKIIQAGWIQSQDISIIGISPDGVSEDETIQFEYKCPGRSVHVATLLANDIPLTNIHQCLHAFTVNPKLKQLHFGSFRPECKIRLFHKVLTPESVINLGTKAKPNLNTVAFFAKQARGNAIKLQEQVETELTKIEF